MHRALSHFVLLAALIAPAIAPAIASAQASPAPFTSATRYDALGRVVGTIAPDPDGAGGSLRYLATRTTYDARGNAIKVEKGELRDWQPESRSPANWPNFTAHSWSETAFDVLNRKIIERHKGLDGGTISLTQYSYDNRGRLECIAVRMNPAAYGSLPSSACTLGPQGPDGPDRITRTFYDAAGQVVQIRKAVGTPDQISDVTYTYTRNGQIENVVDANGNRAKYTYDGHDRLIRWDFPNANRANTFDPNTTSISGSTTPTWQDYEQYTYDANGNRTSLRKRDGRTIVYRYDALNRVTLKDLPYSADLPFIHRQDVHYRYDLRGLRSFARFYSNTNGLGVTYTYDGFGRPTIEHQNSDGVARSVRSQYDANGNRTRVDYPSGMHFTFTHDGLNRLKDYILYGLYLSRTTYNNRGLKSQIDWHRLVHSSNETNYGYDNAGRLSSIGIDVHNTNRDVTWNYTRNPASQIKTESQSNDAYSWDGHVAVNRAYSANGLNQYTTAGSAAFCHDKNGNLTADGTSVYLYDLENRLVQKRVQINSDCNALSYAGALEVELRYDPTGRLYQVSGGSGGTQRFVYDGNALIAEYNSSGTILRQYAHGSNAEADDPLIWCEGTDWCSGNRRFLHADPRGSIVAVTNFQGQSIATNTYDEFGIPDSGTINSGDCVNDVSAKGRFRYTGQLLIPELCMYYYKARIYSFKLGRFMQTDPIGYEDQFNLYAYVGNDPVNSVDPSGMNKSRQAARNHPVPLTPEERASAQALSEEIASSIPVVGAIMAVASFVNDPSLAGAVNLIASANPLTKKASKAAKGTCCFVAGTLVATGDGLRTIEDVSLGDFVWARDAVTGETALKEVTNLIRQHERVIWEVSLDGPGGEQEQFQTTDDHPWWIGGLGWKTTEELRPGMAVVTRDGRGMVIASVVETERTEVTFNLTVADFETYFVGEHRVLVHNCPAGTYRVDGSRTSSKADYIGQTGKDNPSLRSGNGKDGRHRESGDQTTEMPGSTQRERQIQEQKEINAAGGIKKLDNKINAVSPKHWKKYGIDPPKD